MSRLRDLLSDAVDAERPSQESEHLTVAALLMLVAHADGRVAPAEARGMPVLLSDWFGLPLEQSERVLTQVRAIEADLDPATTLIDRILHDVEPEERPRMLALAYRVAAVDGVVHEFEDDLIWRTGRLLGLSDRDLAGIKAQALEPRARDRAQS